MSEVSGFPFSHRSQGAPTRYVGGVLPTCNGPVNFAQVLPSRETQTSVIMHEEIKRWTARRKLRFAPLSLCGRAWYLAASLGCA